MDQTQLPYELQFKYLSKLSIEDIFSYCQCCQVTWQIWQTPIFWDRKAQDDFGIGISHVTGETPSDQYKELARLNRDEPSILLILTIYQKKLDYIPRYFQRANLFSFKNNLFQYNQLVPIMLSHLVEDGSSEELEVLLTAMQDQVGIDKVHHIQTIAYQAYMTARSLRRDDLVLLLDRFLAPVITF